MIILLRADSVTWNPHKLMGTLLQCSTLHLKENVGHFLCLFPVTEVLCGLKKQRSLRLDDDEDDGGCDQEDRLVPCGKL